MQLICDVHYAILSRMKKAVIVIAHGSREAASNEDFFEFLERFRKQYTDRFVQPAFLELAKPSIDEAVDICASKGIEDVVILPLMFFAGRHVKKDIPEVIEKAKMKHPQIDFHYAGPLAEHSGMFDILKDKAAGKNGK